MVQGQPRQKYGDGNNNPMLDAVEDRVPIVAACARKTEREFLGTEFPTYACNARVALRTNESLIRRNVRG